MKYLYRYERNRLSLIMYNASIFHTNAVNQVEMMEKGRLKN